MSLSKDLQNIREHGGASMAELSEFVAKMKGRSPQEVMGLVAGSSLFQATAQATLMTTLFIAAFTVGPYFYYGPVKPPETAAKPAAPAATDTAKKPETPAAPAAGEQATAAATTPKTDAEKAAKAMGIDEVKPADAKKNPLEKNLDNLLDNLK